MVNTPIYIDTSESVSTDTYKVGINVDKNISLSSNLHIGGQIYFEHFYDGTSTGSENQVLTRSANGITWADSASGGSNEVQNLVTRIEALESIVQALSPTYFMCYNNASETVAAGQWTDINLDAIPSSTTTSDVTLSSGNVKIATAGKYFISMGMYFSTNPGTHVYVRKNSTDIIHLASASDTVNNISSALVINISANDELYFRVMAPSGCTIYGAQPPPNDAFFTFISGYRIA